MGIVLNNSSLPGNGCTMNRDLDLPDPLLNLYHKLIRECVNRSLIMNIVRENHADDAPS